MEALPPCQGSRDNAGKAVLSCVCWAIAWAACAVLLNGLVTSRHAGVSLLKPCKFRALM